MSHGGGGDRWLVSYSDFITLLMVLFVVLWSLGQTDLKKYKALATEMRKAFTVGFGGGAPEKVVDPQIDQSGALGAEQIAKPITIEGLPMTSAVGVEVAGKLTDMLNKSNLSAEVSIQNNVEGVLISLSEKLTFEQGTAELTPDAYGVLDAIVEMLAPLENDIKIVGHTDDTPPIDIERYPTNMELSLARAYKIVAFFQDKGIAPKRLIASGRGDSNPIFPNDTDYHKALNSRADIVIIYPQDTNVIQYDLNTQSTTGNDVAPDAVVPEGGGE